MQKVQARKVKPRHFLPALMSNLTGCNFRGDNSGADDEFPNGAYNAVEEASDAQNPRHPIGSQTIVRGRPTRAHGALLLEEAEQRSDRDLVQIQ